MAKEPLFRLAHMQHLGKTMWTYFYRVLPSFPSPFYSLLTYLCSLHPQKGNIPSSDHSEHPPSPETIPVSKKKHCFLSFLRENFWMVASPSSPFSEGISAAVCFGLCFSVQFGARDICAKREEEKVSQSFAMLF